jgi:hypothetical protein
METIELIADIRFQPKKIILLKLWQSLRVHQNKLWLFYEIFSTNLDFVA